MAFFDTQNPGIGGINELTPVEEAFIMNIVGLEYEAGDILYYDGSNLNRLPIGTEGNVLKSVSGLPVWGTSSGGGISGLTAGRISFALDANTLEDDADFVWDKTNNRAGIQVSTPQMPLHVASVTGTGIADVTTGSATLVAETLPSAPTGSISQIPEPSASGGGSGVSFIDAGSGNYLANNATYTYRIYPCLDANGTYYKSQYYVDVSGTDPNDGQYYNISVDWDDVIISGETVVYYVEKDVNSGGFSAFGVYATSDLIDSGSGAGGSVLPWPTFYANIPATPPSAYTGGAATAIDIGVGSLPEVNNTILVEVDSVAVIGGTNYVSGSPTSGNFSDTGLGSYNIDMSWIDNGNASNSIVRISQDSGTTWYYQYTGSSTSPYVINSLSNDTNAEADWGNTYTPSSVQYDYNGYGTGSAPSGFAIYSTSGATYSTTIPADSINYIFKHTFSGGSAPYKILANPATNGISGVSSVLYDIGYTSWVSGVTITPTSYGFTGTAQNRDYKVYSSGSSIFGATPLTVSTTSGSGAKSVALSWTLPSGITTVKILRQVNGGGYTVSKTVTGSSTTDDALDTSWAGNTTVTPNSIIVGAGRFDKSLTTLTEDAQLTLVDTTGSGVRYVKMTYAIASSTSATPTRLADTYVESSTGYMAHVTNRLSIIPSLGGTANVILGNTNVFNNAQGSSNHFFVKGQSDANLINTRSDQDTVGFGQAIGTDQQATVQIHPARSNDTGLVFIGHASQTDSSIAWRTQTSGGSFTSEMTVGGWMRTSNGTITNPSHSCRADTNTGIFFPSADTLGFVTGGAERGRFDSSGRFGIGLTSLGARLDVTEATLGNAVSRIQSTASNDDPNILKYQNRVATTDATVTTLHSVSTTSNNSYLVEAKVLARRTGGSSGTASDTAGYKIIGVFKNNAGTLTQVGATTVEFTAEDQAGWNCVFDTSGTTIRVRVTGATNNNITWHLSELDVNNLST